MRKEGEPTLAQFVADLFVLLLLGSLGAAGGIIITFAVFMAGCGVIHLVQWCWRLLAR